MKKALAIIALVGCGFLAGQSYHPAKAAAESMSNVVFELQQIRQALQEVARNMPTR